MPDRPSGTVAFLFTVIKGSTALWQGYRPAMKRADTRHDAVVRVASVGPQPSAPAGVPATPGPLHHGGA